MNAALDSLRPATLESKLPAAAKAQATRHMPSKRCRTGWWNSWGVAPRPGSFRADDSRWNGRRSGEFYKFDYSFIYFFYIIFSCVFILFAMEFNLFCWTINKFYMYF